MRSHSHKLIHTSFYLSLRVQAFLFFVHAMIGVAEARKLSEDSDDDDDDDGKGKGKGDGSPRRGGADARSLAGAGSMICSAFFSLCQSGGALAERKEAPQGPGGGEGGRGAAQRAPQRRRDAGAEWQDLRGDGSERTSR